jgi:hypothetical protein
MFGKLKAIASNGAVDKVAGSISVYIKDQLKSISTFNVSDLKDDDKYSKMITKPALTAINAGSGGLTKIIPGFKNKFIKMMLHLRNELIDLKGEKPKLKDGFKKNLPNILITGLKS